MHHFFEAITNNHGDALSGYYVRLVDADGNGVSLYADTSLTPIVSVSGLADAAKVDSDGNVDFYVNVGTYQLDIYATDGSTLVKSIPDVGMNIDADTAATAVAAQASASASAIAAANSEAAAAISADSATTDAASARAYLLSLTTLPTSGLGVTAASRAAMSILSTTTPAILGEGVRRGVYHFLTAADYATITGRTLATDIGIDNTTLDGFKGNVIIPVNSDYTGASGAWVYPYWAQDVSARLFGARDGTDIKAALEAWATVVYTFPCVSASCTVTGTAALPITLGNTSGSQTKRISLTATINATAAMDVLLTIVKPSTIDLNLSLWGSSVSTSGQAWADRLAGYGLRITAALNSRITGKISPTNFKFWGVLLDDSLGINSSNSNYVMLPYIRGNSCGISNAAGGSLAMSSTWNTPVRVGTTGSLNQTTTIKVSAAPTVDAVEATTGWLYWIAGYPYPVKTMADNGDGTYTLTLYAPWLDNTSYNSGAGSGTGFYTVGGVCAVKGTDANVAPVESVFGTNCGYVFWDGTAYGVTPRRLSTDGGCDVLYAFGRFTNAAHYGGGFDELYIEGTGELAQVLSVGPTGSDRVVIGKITGAGPNFAKWFKIAPRAVTGDSDNNSLYYQAMTEITSVAGYAGKIIVAGYGCDFSTTWDPGNCVSGTPVTTTLSIPAGLGNGQPLRWKFSQKLSGLVPIAYVSGTPLTNSTTVTLQLSNPTGSAVDLASGTATVTLLQ